MTRIKICGITDVETAGLCARLGADFIGLVFAESRRKVTPELAVESVPGAIHIPLPELRGRLGELPKDRDILVF